MNDQEIIDNLDMLMNFEILEKADETELVEDLDQLENTDANEGEAKK